MELDWHPNIPVFQYIFSCVLGTFENYSIWLYNKMASLEGWCYRLGKDLNAMAPTFYLTEISPLPELPEGIVQIHLKAFSPFWGTLLHFLTGPNPGENSKSTTYVHSERSQRKLSAFFSWFSNDSLPHVKFCDSSKCLFCITKGGARVSKEFMQIL